jgi:adenylate kinase
MPSPLNLILLGPPGAGKGTQASRLQADLCMPLISTGAILRASVNEGTELGRAAKAHMDAGGLVPDDLIIATISERLEQRDTDAGFILDGFPRTDVQAAALNDQLDKRGRGISAALLISVSDAEIVKRVAGRRVCAEAGHNYHVDYQPPKRAGLCDRDGSELLQRDDDKAGVVEARLSVYHEHTAPLVDYYRERGLLRTVDGSASPAAVYGRIQLAVAVLWLQVGVIA